MYNSTSLPDFVNYYFYHILSFWLTWCLQNSYSLRKYKIINYRKKSIFYLSEHLRKGFFSPVQYDHYLFFLKSNRKQVLGHLQLTNLLWATPSRILTTIFLIDKCFGFKFLQAPFPLNTWRKFNVHMTFWRHPDFLWNSHVNSIYVLYPRGCNASIILFHIILLSCIIFIGK